MAAVAARSSANNSPHLGAKGMTASPRSSNKTSESQSKDTATSKSSAPPDTKPDIPTINKPDEAKDSTSTTNAPLAPPPRPNQNGEAGGDYFGGQHFSKEPNPFESAFGGGGSAETPGKTQLPGVTSLTSPAPLLPGNTPAWPGSLRSGPLSPAMLTGPTGSNDYFNSDHHFGGSFPTPNESSLRTGLTPGGGGSMFPQPSPNSQALYNQLQSGGATPGTLDFHRTAMTARAQTQVGNYGVTSNAATSQPQPNPNIQPDLDSKPYTSSTTTQHNENQDPFHSHQANDATSAASGLFMLAQSAGQQRNGAQGYPLSQQQQQQPHYASAQSENRAVKHNSVDSASTQGGQGDYSDASNEPKPAARGRSGKKGASAGKGGAAGKRKNEETPSKAASKKQRAESEEMDMDMDDMETGPDGKKMTDEEKRKNFLERNRVAALKCRQRKKQWLANLQQKVEIFSSENDALAATVTQLREEIVGLKTLLLAHKDCPVSQAQGISGMAMQQLANDAHQYANPYGMAMGPSGPQSQMQQAAMQRR